MRARAIQNLIRLRGQFKHTLERYYNNGYIKNNIIIILRITCIVKPEQRSEITVS